MSRNVLRPKRDSHILEEMRETYTKCIILIRRDDGVNLADAAQKKK